jgi:D-3-phosphoglycerate dehydrogenase
MSLAMNVPLDGTGRSWWLDDALRGDTPRPALEGHERADVCIVGGGYTGLWTALRLKELEPMALQLHEDGGMTGDQPVHPAALLIDPFFAPNALAELLAPDVAVHAGGPDAAGPDTVVVITSDRPVRAQDLADAPNLQLVITASVGFDHVDLESFRERGVKVCHTPAYCTEEVADHTIAAVLSLLRGLHRFDRAIQAGEWDIASGGPLRRIRGTKLGIVGLGRIGRAVAERGRALGMEVIGSHATGTAEEIAELGVRLASLEELLAEADVVSLHARSDPTAPPLLGPEQFALMRPHALLVNTGRAALVDLDALVERLDAGRLAGAHFDVWPSEPPDWDDPRLRARNLFLSPHAAWASPSAEAALWRETAHAITAVLAGQDPPHRLA